MSAWFEKFMQRVKRSIVLWLDADAEKTQAEVMGTALAGAKAGELCATLLARIAANQERLVRAVPQPKWWARWLFDSHYDRAVMVDQSLTAGAALGFLTMAATEFKKEADEYEEGTPEWLAVQETALALFKVAEVVQETNKQEEQRNADAQGVKQGG